MVRARAELDSKKRREMYFEMQSLCRDEGGVVVPMFANYVFATTNQVGIENLASNWDMDGIKAVERWWLA